MVSEFASVLRDHGLDPEVAELAAEVGGANVFRAAYRQWLADADNVDLISRTESAMALLAEIVTRPRSSSEVDGRPEEVGAENIRETTTATAARLGYAPFNTVTDRAAPAVISGFKITTHPRKTAAQPFLSSSRSSATTLSSIPRVSSHAEEASAAKASNS